GRRLLTAQSSWRIVTSGSVMLLASPMATMVFSNNSSLAFKAESLTHGPGRILCAMTTTESKDKQDQHKGLAGRKVFLSWILGRIKSRQENTTSGATYERQMAKFATERSPLRSPSSPAT